MRFFLTISRMLICINSMFQISNLSTSQYRKFQILDSFEFQNRSKKSSNRVGGISGFVWIKVRIQNLKYEVISKIKIDRKNRQITLVEFGIHTKNQRSRNCKTEKVWIKITTFRRTSRS